MKTFAILMIILFSSGEPKVGTSVFDTTEECRAAGEQFTKEFQAAHPNEPFIVGCVTPK